MLDRSATCTCGGASMLDRVATCTCEGHGNIWRMCHPHQLVHVWVQDGYSVGDPAPQYVGHHGRLVVNGRQRSW